MEKTNNKNFAKIYNCFTEPSTQDEQQYKLTPQELYLYATLSIRKTRVRDVLSVVTSIDLLSQQVTVYKRQPENKKMISALLGRLQARGLISCCEPNSNSELIEIFFPDNEVLDKCGFESVYGALFDLADDAEQFTILTVVQRWQSAEGGCTTGISRWTDILECGRNKVTEMLEAMKDAGKIVVKSGKQRQSYNRYWIGDGVPIVRKNVNQAATVDTEDVQRPTDLVATINDTWDVDLDPVDCMFDTEQVEDDVLDVKDEQSQQDVPEAESVYPVESADKQHSDPFVRQQREESDGLALARYLAEVQPLAAQDVLYGEQFTDPFQRLPRAVLTDVRMYAEHFKVNPNEDVYVQVTRLRRGVEWGVMDLYLQAVDFDEVS